MISVHSHALISIGYWNQFEAFARCERDARNTGSRTGSNCRPKLSSLSFINEHQQCHTRIVWKKTAQIWTIQHGTHKLHAMFHWKQNCIRSDGHCILQPNSPTLSLSLFCLFGSVSISFACMYTHNRTCVRHNFDDISIKRNFRIIPFVAKSNVKSNIHELCIRHVSTHSWFSQHQTTQHSSPNSRRQQQHLQLKTMPSTATKQQQHFIIVIEKKN